MNQRKILLIEDDLDFASATTTILKKGGYEVILSTTGREGIKKSIEAKPDLIILDVMLPDQEGFSVCREIKDNATTQQIPVLILTSVSGKARGEGYAEKISVYHKSDAYLEKPVKPNELLDTVKMLIRTAAVPPRDRKITILLADDDRDFLAATRTILEAHEYSVLVAENGEECIAMARSHRPDMIVLDVMMPDKDGFTVCYELKDDAQTRSIPVLMLTAVGEQFKKPDFAQEIAIDHQANDYADKPITPDHLLRKIRKLTIY